MAISPSTIMLAGSAIKKGSEYATTIAAVAQALDSAEDMTNVSLPAYVKKCSILHRVYIQRELAGEEEIIYNVLMNTQNMVAAWVLCALQLNTRIDGMRTTRKLLDVVATENYGTPVVTMLEKFVEKYSGNIYGKELLEGDHFINGTPSYATGDMSSLRGDVSDIDNTIHASPGKSGKDVDINEKVRLPSGKILEVDFGNKNTVSVWLQLMPLLIPEDVMQQFVALNFTTLTERWLKLTAGEISFLKDFIANADRRKAKKKALIKDKHGLLEEMENRRSNTISKAFSKLLMYRPTRQNLATSILVYDKVTFDRISKRHNFKMDRVSDKQKFFNATYAMMVVVVDPMYGTVDFYINGLDARATYTLRQLESSAKSDKISVMDIMQAMSRNQTPKF